MSAELRTVYGAYCADCAWGELADSFTEAEELVEEHNRDNHESHGQES